MSNIALSSFVPVEFCPAEAISGPLVNNFGMSVQKNSCICHYHFLGTIVCGAVVLSIHLNKHSPAVTLTARRFSGLHNSTSIL